MLNFSSRPPHTHNTTTHSNYDNEELEEGEIIEHSPLPPHRKHHFNPLPRHTSAEVRTRQDSSSFLNEEKAFVDMILQNPKLALQHLRNSPLSPQDIIGLFNKFKAPVPDLLQAMCTVTNSPTVIPTLVRGEPDIPTSVARVKVEEAESDDMEIEGEEEDTHFTCSILPLGPWITTTTSVAEKPEVKFLATSDALKSTPVADIGRRDASGNVITRSIVENLEARRTLSADIIAQYPEAGPTSSTENIKERITPTQTLTNTNATPTSSSFVPFSFPSQRPVSSKGNGFPRQPHSMVIDLSFSDEEEDPNDHVTQFLRACRDAASVSVEARKEEDASKAKKRQEEDDSKAKESRQTLEEKERDIQLMKARIQELQRSKKRISSSSIDVASPTLSASSGIVQPLVLPPNGLPGESNTRPLGPQFTPICEIPVHVRADLDARAAELRAQLLKKLSPTILSLSRSGTPEPAPNNAEAGETEQAETVTETLFSAAAPVPSDVADSMNTEIHSLEPAKVPRNPDDGVSFMQRYMNALGAIESQQKAHVASIESLKSLLEDLNRKQSEAQQKLKALEEEEEQRVQRKSLVEKLLQMNGKRSETPQPKIAGTTERLLDTPHVAIPATAEPMEVVLNTTRPISEANVEPIQASIKRPPSSPDDSSHRVVAKKPRLGNVASCVVGATSSSKDQEIAELEAAMCEGQKEQLEIRKAAEQRRRIQIGASSLLKYPKLEAVLSGKKLTDQISIGVEISILSNNVVPAEAITPTTVELVVRGGFLQTESSMAVLSDVDPPAFDVEGQQDHSTVSGKVANDPSKDAKYNGFRPYISAISTFRSIGNRSVEGIRSATQTSKIDPIQKLCIYETSGGNCNDDACTSQHFKNVAVTDDDILASLASKIPSSFANEKDRYLDGLRDVVRKAQMDDKTSTADLVKAITEYQKSNSGSETVVLVSSSSSNSSKTQSQPVIAEEAVSTSASSGAAPQPSVVNNAMMSVVLRVPVVVEGLVKLMEGESDSKGRYFADSLSDDDYRLRVERDPADAVVWLNWAASQLPDAINAGILARPGLALDQAILILSKCLRHHHRSESVWLFYMELLCRRGKDLKIRMMFQKALEYTRNSPAVAWRFYQWEPEVQQKHRILQEMLQNIANHKMACNTRCELVLSILLQIVLLKTGHESVAEAKKMHFHLLTCKDLELFEMPSAVSLDKFTTLSCLSESALFKILRPEDIATMWLAYLHLLAYDRLPSALFHCSPYEYHVRQPMLFEIVWPEDAIKEESRRNEIGSILNALIAKWPEVVDNKIGISSSTLRASARAARGAIWRNFVAYAMSTGRLGQVENMVEGWTKTFPGLPEGCDLLAEICVKRGNISEAKQRLSDLAMAGGLGFAGLWNRLVKLVIQQSGGSEASTAIAEILVRAIRSCFDVEDEEHLDLNYNVEAALDMYRYVLGVGTPAILEMPSLRSHLDKRAMRTSVHIWLNYMILQRLQYTSTQVLGDTPAMIAQALEALKEAEDRELIWKEWIRYESTSDGTSLLSTQPKQDLRITPVLSRAVQDLKFTQPYQYAATVSANNESDWMKMSPDFTNLDRLLNVALPALTPTKASDILNLIHQRYPNAIPVCLRAINDDVQHNRIRQAQSRIWALIRRFPAVESLWRVALNLELQSGKTTSSLAAQNIYIQAALFLPPNSVSAIKAQFGEAETGTMEDVTNQITEF